MKYFAGKLFVSNILGGFEPAEIAQVIDSRYFNSMVSVFFDLDRSDSQFPYRRGTRLEILQRISYGELLAHLACSSASTLNPSLVPSKITSSPTAIPGIPVTSTSVRSIEMLPMMGA